METNISTSSLQVAVEHCGGQKQLAEKIGTTQSMVWYWLREAKKGVPAEFVGRIVAAAEGRVAAHELRPDIFPPSFDAHPHDTPARPNNPEVAA